MSPAAHAGPPPPPPPPDSCGYPTGTSGLPATPFSEDTLSKLIQVNGSGSTATVSVFAADERSILLGISDSKGTATPFTPSGSTQLTTAVPANSHHVTSLSVAVPHTAVVQGDTVTIGYGTAQQKDLKASAVAGTGSSTIAVTAFDTDATHSYPLGTPVVDKTSSPTYGHVTLPPGSVGDTSTTSPPYDASARPQYPSLFVTDLGPAPGSPSAAGDWQHGGTPVPPNDVFGVWVTGTYDSAGTYHGPMTLPAKNATQSSWNLGPGSDLPNSGFTALGDPQGYGAEVRWNVSSLNLTPGDVYRFQAILHDGDQNKSGGDAGELCTTLAVPAASGKCANFPTTDSLGSAANYNEFAIDNADRGSNSSSDTEGRSAYGGNATLQQYFSGDWINGVSLVVGNNVSGTMDFGSTATGTYGGASTATDANNPGSPVPDLSKLAPPFDFTAVGNMLRSLSEHVNENSMTQGATAITNGSLLYLEGSDPDLDVFNLSPGQFAAAQTIFVKVPAGAVVAVNVPDTVVSPTAYQDFQYWNGSGYETGDQFGSAAATSVRDHTLINFPNASTITFQAANLAATVLAPFATVTFNNGVLNGNLIADNINGDFQSNYVPPFTGSCS